MKKTPYTKKILSNNLRVIVVPMDGTEAVTILVLVKTGSDYETKRINGASHFLEHLFFKGTKHRPNAGDVSRELDRMGAEHNAFTGKEATGYWVKTAGKHFDIALDIIADILLEPLFKAEEIERERGVILQEISMYEDLPMRKVFEVWEELLYGDQPAGWPIAGTAQTVKGITRDDVLSYKEKQYGSGNTVVVVAGNINKKDTLAKVAKIFKTLPDRKPYNKKTLEKKNVRDTAKLFYKDTDQTHIILGAPAYHMYDERRFSLNLLNVILGGTASSRLFMKIREHHGLAYYVNSSVEGYTDSGYLACRAGIPHSALSEVARKISEELYDLALNGPTEDEVRFAKDNLRGSLALQFESSDDIAHFYAERELFYKALTTPEELLKKFEKVTRNDMIKVARELFKEKFISMAVIGPHRALNFTELIRRAFGPK